MLDRPTRAYRDTAPPMVRPAPVPWTRCFAGLAWPSNGMAADGPPWAWTVSPSLGVCHSTYIQTDSLTPTWPRPTPGETADVGRTGPAFRSGVDCPSIPDRTPIETPHLAAPFPTVLRRTTHSLLRHLTNGPASAPNRAQPRRSARQVRWSTVSAYATRPNANHVRCTSDGRCSRFCAGHASSLCHNDLRASDRFCTGSRAPRFRLAQRKT